MRIAYRGSPVEERFWPRVDKHGPTPTARSALGPCWIWQGKPSRDGYGRIGLGGGRGGPVMLAHRFAYELLVGPIPDGLTRGENVLRGVGFAAENARKTHCPQGHAYDQRNTYTGRGYRECRACDREKHRPKGRVS